jgi:hypothetical protein
LELGDGDFGLDRGGFESFVAEELLDEADVGAAFEQVGGAAAGSFRGGHGLPS